VTKTKWALDPTVSSPAPLPPKQKLHQEFPEAYVTAEALEASQASFSEIAETADATAASGITAVPVVLISHIWESEEHPDPNGSTLARLASNLARMMPTYQAWGYADVGVFFDWACMHQTIPALGLERTKEEEAIYFKAKRELKIWFSHRMSTVYIIDDQQVTPLPAEHGWPFFIDAACQLFKDIPPTKPFKVGQGQLVPFWSKYVRLSDEEVLNDTTGVNPQAGTPKRKPPLSAPHFLDQLRTKWFADEKKPRTEPGDRDLIIHLYRAAIEDGFNSLERLSYGKLGWTDEDVTELGACFQEVSCPHVTELDLSWNDMRSGSGLDAIGTAIAHGALHSLQKLNLINCTAVKTLPENLCELLELQVILLDGCVQLRMLPPGMHRLASLKLLSIINCHLIFDDALRGLPSSTNVVRFKEGEEEA